MNETANPDPSSPSARSADTTQPRGSAGRRIFRSVLWVGLPVVVLGGAVAAAGWMIRNKPRARRRGRPPRVAHLVDVTRARVSSHQVAVEAMGTVTPARKVDIHPQVQGEIVWMNKNLVPGGVFRKGELMLRIDASDYRLAVRQSESAVAKAESELAVERGLQSVAKKEYTLLGKKVSGGNRDLMLRKPQLKTAKAAVAGAKAALARARLDLKRTSIRAPFNAVVESRHVNRGSRVMQTNKLFTLVGTDAYWVEVSVPVDQLRWIQVPEKGVKPGSPVRVRDEAAWGKGAYREGRVLRLRPDLEEKGRMARVLVEVSDPLALKQENKGKPRLLAASYVAVEILGARMESVVTLKRSLLRDGDRVWVFNKKGELEIRKVRIGFRGRDRVFVTHGLRQGERVVTTDLATPVNGMPLRTRSKGKPGTGKAGGTRPVSSAEKDGGSGTGGASPKAGNP